MLHGKEAIYLLRNHLLQDYTVLDTPLSTLLTLDDRESTETKRNKYVELRFTNVAKPYMFKLKQVDIF